MLTLKDWLKRVPREVSVAIHAAHYERHGIYSHARIEEELLTWALDPSRPDQLDDTASRLLERTALAGGERLEITSLPEDGSNWEEAAAVLRDNLWCFMERSESGVFLSLFADHLPLILGRRLARIQSPEPAPASPLPWRWRFLQGLSGLIAKLQLGRMRLNRDGHLNRRDQQILEEVFTPLTPLGACRDDALRLGLTLLGEIGGLRTSESRLELDGSPDELLSALRERLLPWWQEHHPQCQRLLSAWQDRWLPLAEAVHWFGPTTGKATGKLTWSHLPLPLRLAILCGAVEPRSGDRQIQAVHAGSPEDPSADVSRLTPDLKLLLSPGAGLDDWYRAQLLGNLESCELYSTFSLSRESWLGGIATTGIDGIWQWIRSMSPSENVLQTLTTWTEARTLCALRTVSVLQVRDSRRQRELATLPQMKPFIREEIPGWGFILDTSCEPELRELLNRLGYNPPPLREEELVWTPLTSIPGLNFQPDLIGIPACDPVWPSTQSSSSPAPVVTRTRFSGPLRELGAADLIPLLEYAIVVGTPLEIVLKSSPRRSQTLIPDTFNRRRSPLSLEGRGTDGTTRTVPLDAIRKIRLIED